MNRRVVESLIRAGAFDALDDHRARLLAAVGVALESAEQASRAAQPGEPVRRPSRQSRRRPALLEVPRWDVKERLQNEKAALGYYFSDHLFNIYATEVRRFVRTRIADLARRERRLRGPATHWIAGVVLSVRMQNTAMGRMAILTLADDSGREEIVVFSKSFEKFRHKLKDDELLVLEVQRAVPAGRAATRTATRAANRGSASRWSTSTTSRRRASASRAACAHLQRAVLRQPPARSARALSQRHAARCRSCTRTAARCCEIDLGEAWRVNLHDDLIRSLGEWLSPENVRIVYGEARAQPVSNEC